MVNQLPDAPVLDVLADPTRRAVVAMLAARPHPAGELAAACAISRPALSRHLRLLRSRGAVEEYRIPQDGRVRMYRLRREPLDDVARWAATLQSFWAHQLAAFAGFVRTEAGERSKAWRRPRGRIPGRRSKRDGRRRHGRASQR